MPTALDNGRRSPRKLLRAVVARLLGGSRMDIREPSSLPRPSSHSGAVFRSLISASPGESVGTEGSRSVKGLITTAVVVAVLLASGVADAAAATCDGVAATIVGTSGPDRLAGTPGRDVIQARRGNDIIRGRGGNDLICARLGRDDVEDGGGQDVVFLGRGNDFMRDLRGSDVINMGAGSDEVNDGPGNDIFRGGRGNDDVDLYSGGDDRFRGGRGRDRVTSLDQDSPVTIDLTAGTVQGLGNDTVSSVESAEGSFFNDTLIGSAAKNVLGGDDGSDHIEGREGNDVLLGGGGGGADFLDGGDGFDTCIGFVPAVEVNCEA